MPRIVVNNKSFNVEVGGSDTGQIPPGGTSIRLPVCSLVYPPAGEFMLNEPIGNSDLGSLSFSVEATGESFSSKNQPVTINNKLVVKQVQVDVDDSEFRPCYLDFDKDGVISARDVEKVYRDIPFVDPRFDVNGDGIVDSEDFTLAKEYVGTVCQVGPPPPPKVMPVLDLDCFNYEGGDTWHDASGNDYHFVREFASNGNIVEPIKNEDGSITLGTYRLLDSDPDGPRRFFVRRGVVEYDPDKAFTEENILNQTATTEGVYKEKYIPDVDQDYSFEFIYRFTEGVPNGAPQTEAGATGNQTNSTNSRCKVFGYANYGYGGYNFGTGYSAAAYATNPDIGGFIPYRGVWAQTYAGRGAGTQPGQYPDNSFYPHSSEYPNPLPYSKLVSNRYNGGNIGDVGFDLGLDPDNGLSDGSMMYVQYVVSPSTQTALIYINGNLSGSKYSGIGVGFPDGRDSLISSFLIGASPQGGWGWPRAVDVFMLRVYDEALSEEEVINNYNRYLEKYGS